MVYFPKETDCLITGPSDKKALLYNSTCHYSFNLGNKLSKPTIKFKISSYSESYNEAIKKSLIETQIFTFL